MIDKQAKELRLQFCKYGQEHVFKFWEILSDDEQSKLIQQVKTIDMDYLAKIITGALHDTTKQNRNSGNLAPAKFIKFPNSEIDWQK